MTDSRPSRRAEQPFLIRHRHVRLDRTHGRDDSFRRLIRIFVFPHTDHAPASLVEKAIGLGVALACTVHLLRPKAGVGHGDRVVDGTAVPETSIQKHRHLRPREDQIRRPTNGGERAIRDSVSEPLGVYGTTKGELRLGVPTLVRAHACPYGIAGRP